MLSARPLALGRSLGPLDSGQRATCAASHPWRPLQQRGSLLARVAEHTGTGTSHDNAEHPSSWQGHQNLATLDVEALTTRLANTTRLAEVLAEQLEQADQVGGPLVYILRWPFSEPPCHTVVGRRNSKLSYLLSKHWCTGLPAR